MTDRLETLAARIDERFGDQATRVASSCRELTIEVDKDDLVTAIDLSTKGSTPKQRFLRTLSITQYRIPCFSIYVLWYYI